MTRLPILLVVCALSSTLISFGTAQDNKKDAKPEESQLTDDEQAVVDLTNAERKKAEKDLKPLKVNPKLMAAARKHAANMAAQEKFDHVLDEKTPADRAKAEGYEYRALGENIAFSASTPKDVVEGWMGSELHRDNILNAEYAEIGVAVAKSKKGEHYWVQVFGKP